MSKSEANTYVQAEYNKWVDEIRRKKNVSFAAGLFIILSPYFKYK